MDKENAGTLIKHDAKAELENTFIMRLPIEVAQSLRQAVKGGSMSLKDRLSIQIENDMRSSTVRFDNWVLSGKILDLPTITESLKTINRKTFYKTADICQILICKEGEDNSNTDEEASPNKKKRDPNKVDKKFLLPHGLTPSLKNARKRRFRKTMKKKFVDAPEIEKEVKRLLRVDNDAVSVHYEVVMDEDETKGNAGIQEACQDSSSMPASGDAPNQSVAEHDIFGEAVSDSDEENHDRPINIVSEEDSRSRLSDSMYQSGESRKQEDMTEFKSGFLRQHQPEHQQPQQSEQQQPPSPTESSSQQQQFQAPQQSTGLSGYDLSRAEELLETYRQQLNDLRMTRMRRETEKANIDNPVLRQRFQYEIEQAYETEVEIERKYHDLRNRLTAAYMMGSQK